MISQAEQNQDTPEFAVDPSRWIPRNDYLLSASEIPPSRMFEIKNALSVYKTRMGPDAEVYDASQGDGGASLPGVPREILDRAHQLQIEHGTGYDKPYGTDHFRRAAAEDYWGFDRDTGFGPENIIFAQGGRDGLLKAYAAIMGLGHGEIGGALVVSRIPWISYNWGPYAAGMNVLRAPGRAEDAWRLTPEGIVASARYAAERGHRVSGIVITSPDNPTGRTMPVTEQAQLARSALEAGYPYVIFDWIYHWVTDSGPSDINQVLKSFSHEERERLIFLDGISKSLGASNIRSAHLVAGQEVIRHINSRASHGVIPSYYAQAVAIAAFEMGFEKAAKSIIEPCRASRRALRAFLDQKGARYIAGDGYYAFIDLSEYIDKTSFDDSAGLGKWLGENFGVTIVPGVYFSDAGAKWARFSYALPPEKTTAAINRLFEGLDSLG